MYERNYRCFFERVSKTKISIKNALHPDNFVIEGGNQESNKTCLVFLQTFKL